MQGWIHDHIEVGATTLGGKHNHIHIKVSFFVCFVVDSWFIYLNGYGALPDT
jgi:hypothetical protein